MANWGNSNYSKIDCPEIINTDMFFTDKKDYLKAINQLIMPLMK